MKRQEHEPYETSRSMWMVGEGWVMYLKSQGRHIRMTNLQIENQLAAIGKMRPVHHHLSSISSSHIMLLSNFDDFRILETRQFGPGTLKLFKLTRELV